MHIVLVESDDYLLRLVKRVLHARNDTVYEFNDGAQVLKCIRDNVDIDGILTDLTPKSLSGLSVCNEVRRLAVHHRPIYIALLSKRRDRWVLIEALDSGADDIIYLPLFAKELQARLRAAESALSMQRDLICIATFDPLTGALNRRAFFEKAEQIRKLAKSDTDLTA